MQEKSLKLENLKKKKNLVYDCSSGNY